MGSNVYGIYCRLVTSLVSPDEQSGKNLLVEESLALVILTKKILRNTAIHKDTAQRTPEQRFTGGSECR